jgi:NitT/TauT family transport system ATP-binding protein
MAARSKQMAPMSAFAVTILRKAYDSREGRRLAIAGLSFEVREGELVCVLGPSGAGKTTTLNIIAGLDSNFEGKLTFPEGTPHRLSYVFQDPRLLPWRTLIENVALPLKGKPDAFSVAASWLDRVGLSRCHNLYPGQASVGMQRRAAIARAFAFSPTVLLMDEPFVSLDEKAARELRSLFIELWKAERVTTLFVTHNVAEAAELATRVLVFSGSPARVAADIDMRREEAGGGNELLLRSALEAAHASPANT